MLFCFILFYIILYPVLYYIRHGTHFSSKIFYFSSWLYFVYTCLGSHVQLQKIKSNHSCRHRCTCELLLVHQILRLWTSPPPCSLWNKEISFYIFTKAMLFITIYVFFSALSFGFLILNSCVFLSLFLCRYCLFFSAMQLKSGLSLTGSNSASKWHVHHSDGICRNWK